MHVFWNDDVTAKRRPEELLKGGCENAASYWSAGTGPAAMKPILLAAAFGCGPYVFRND